MPGDIVAIVLGLISFAVLYLLMEAIDRVLNTLGFFFLHMGAADFFALLISIVICI
jgi:hypothetical protein